MTEAQEISFCSIKNGNVVCSDVSLFQPNNATDIHETLLEIYKYLGISYAKFHKMDAMCKAGFIAAELLLQNISAKEKEALCICFANQNASLESDLRHFANLETDVPSPAVFVYTLPNIVVGEICIRHKIMGENTFFIMQKPEWHWLVNYGNLSMENSGTKLLLGGWINISGNYADVFLYLQPQIQGKIEDFANRLQEKYIQWNNS